MNKHLEQQKQPREKIDNTQLLKESGLRVVHVRPRDKAVYIRAGQQKGMTVAYEPVSGKAVVRISTSLCKRGDTFCKKLGTRQAIENFKKGQVIFVPVDKELGVVNSLRDMFGW